MRGEDRGGDRAQVRHRGRRRKKLTLALHEAIQSGHVGGEYAEFQQLIDFLLAIESGFVTVSAFEYMRLPGAVLAGWKILKRLRATLAEDTDAPD
jgi:hypothetical protein